MFILYDLIFLVYAILYLPILLVRGKFHAGLAARFGFLPRIIPSGRPVWVHAVSVGEAASIRGLVAQLRKEFPDARFVFTTVTPTGNTVIRSVALAGDLVTYLPLDLSFIVRKFFRLIAPRCLVIVETELWPNLIYEASRRKIPVVIVNGRVSDASFGRYRMIRPLLSPLLNRLDCVCVQSQRDGDRFAALGLRAPKIRVTGNMKFDIPMKEPSLRARENTGRKLWIAASTHKGEETAVLEAFVALRRKFPSLVLLIAPRHPERTPEVEAEVARTGLKAQRVSSLADPAAALGEADGGTVFILDTVGRLMDFYGLADIVFVGGSLVKKGGHNVLEPASLGKPVLCGPFMFNFRDIARLFLEQKAMLTVTDAAGLAEKASRLLGDPAYAASLAAAASKVIAANRGATLRNAGVIKNLLASTRV